jgi:hypothetical protein
MDRKRTASEHAPESRLTEVHFYQNDNWLVPPLKLVLPRVYERDIDPHEERDVAILEQLGFDSCGENHRDIPGEPEAIPAAATIDSVLGLGLLSKRSSAVFG